MRPTRSSCGTLLLECFSSSNPSCWHLVRPEAFTSTRDPLVAQLACRTNALRRRRCPAGDERTRTGFVVTHIGGAGRAKEANSSTRADPPSSSATGSCCPCQGC
eukprot:757881-Hanusia_phi.AAC.1